MKAPQLSLYSEQKERKGMSNFIPILSVIGCYFVGNISPAILIGKIMGVEIRKEGSGNAGTTNVLRVLGKKAAAATLVIDICKGVIAVTIGGYIGGQQLAMACGLAAFLGHIWPLVFGFRGGKGIATAFGIIVTLEPMLGLIEAATAVIFLIASRRVSVGSITAAVLLPFAAYYFDKSYLILAIAMASIVILKHRANIVRLIRREEPKVSFKKQEGKND